jgi:purine-nucleoside phosphorylase
MSDPYARALRQLARRTADRIGVTLTEGVYAALLGPCYETPAEIRMLRTLGADLAGMSTAFETIAANHMGAEVLGISCVTNKAAGLGGKLSHDDVKETAARVKQTFIQLLRELICDLGARERDAEQSDEQESAR